VQHISDLISKFVLRPHHVRKYGRQLQLTRPVNTGAQYTLPVFTGRVHACHFWTPVNTGHWDMQALLLMLMTS